MLLTSFHAVLDNRVVFFMAVFTAHHVVDVESGTLEVVSQTVKEVYLVVVNVV